MALQAVRVMVVGEPFEDKQEAVKAYPKAAMARH